MYLPLIIVSVFYVGVTDSLSCYNSYCFNSSDYTQYGQTVQNNCSDPFTSTGAATCNGDICLVTTQYYYDSREPISQVWRQCASSASLPKGASTTECQKNSTVFGPPLFLDGNLCCYNFTYNQTSHFSNVTYCYCVSDSCNDKLYKTNFSSSTSDPSAPPGPNSPTTLKPSSTGTGSGLDLQSVGFIGAIMIPILSTAIVSVTMILSAVCLWKMSTE